MSLDDEGNLHVVQAGLESSLKRVELLPIIQKYVAEANEGRALMFQFASLHMIRKLEQNVDSIKLRELDHNWFRNVSIRFIFEGYKVNKRTKAMEEEKRTADLFWSLREGKQVLPRNVSVNETMYHVGTNYFTSLRNNIMMHYEQHLQKIIKHMIDPDKKMTKKNRHAEMGKVKNSNPLDPRLYNFVLNNDLSATLECLNEKETIIDVLPCMWKINQYCKEHQLKQFAVFPVARHFGDSHVLIDSTILDKLLISNADTYVSLAKRKREDTRNDPKPDSNSKRRRIIYAQQVLLPLEQQPTEVKEKTTTWLSVFSLPKHNSANRRFSGSITTNGIEVSFHFVPNVVVTPSKKVRRKVSKSTLIGSKGVYREGEVLIPSNANVVGLDPGYIKLIVATDDPQRTSRKQRNVLTITSKQKKIDIGQTVTEKHLNQAKTDNKIFEHERQITSRKFCSLIDVEEYIQSRSQVEQKLRKFYNQKTWRRKKWKQKRKWKRKPK